MNTVAKDVETGNEGAKAARRATSGKVLPFRKKDPSAYPHWECLFAGRAPVKHRPGVYWLPVQKNKQGAVTGYGEPIFLCSPLEVRAKVRDPRNNRWGRLLIFPDSEGIEHRWVCPHEIHGGRSDKLREALLNQGLEISTDRKMRERVAEYIQDAKVEALARVVTRTGWAGDVYVLPDRVAGNDHDEPVLLERPPVDNVGIGIGGTAEGWREQVSKPCAGNSRLVLAVSMALAGPCLGLMLDAEGGGIHIKGDSSSGKSTAQDVAASVYGRPRGADAYVRSWRNTANGLEGTATAHSDMTLILDEINELEAKDAGSVVYMLANGQGKGRLRADTSLRPLPNWRLLFLSSGEISPADLIKKSGSRVYAGQEVRCADVPADAGKGFRLFDEVPGCPADASQGQRMAAGDAFARSLKAAAVKNYGHVLTEFLAALTADVEKARETITELRDAIQTKLVPAGAGGQVRRVAARFALIGAAGELATAHGITGWDIGEAERATTVCFKAWLGARGTAGDTERPAMLDRVRGFLSANSEGRFADWDKHSDQTPRTPNRAGYREDTANGPVYHIEPTCFRNEICAGFSAKAVVEALVEIGALERDRGGKAAHKERAPDGRNTRMYLILPALWNEGEK